MPDRTCQSYWELYSSFAWHLRDINNHTVSKCLFAEATCLADGETILLSHSKLASCEALLDRFAARGGPNVRSLAAELKAKMREGALFDELGIQTE